MTRALSTPAFGATTLATEPSCCPLCGPDALHRAVASGPDFEYRTSGDHEWAIHQCLVCDTLYLNPRPTEAALPVIYPSNYYAFSFSQTKSLAYRAKGYVDRLSVRKYLALYPGEGLVCDIGAGDGRLVDLLAHSGALAPNSVYGIEPSLAAATAAQQRGIDVRHATMEGFDWQPDSHGLLVLQQVIEHVSDPAACLRLAARALRPGGCLVLETPNGGGFDARLFHRRHWGGYHIPRHFFLFNPASLCRLGEQAGLSVVRVDALPSPNFWIQSMHHYGSERGGVGASLLMRLFRPHPPRVLPLALFTCIDLVTAALFNTTSNMRVVLRKEPGRC